MHHFTCWTLFISRINRAWLYKCHEDSGWQLNVDLAQLVRHWSEDLEVLGSILTGGNFWRIVVFFFALPCVKICQIIWQKRLSWKTQLSWLVSWQNTKYCLLVLAVLWFLAAPTRQSLFKPVIPPIDWQLKTIDSHQILTGLMKSIYLYMYTVYARTIKLIINLHYAPKEFHMRPKNISFTLPSIFVYISRI